MGPVFPSAASAPILLVTGSRSQPNKSGGGRSARVHENLAALLVSEAARGRTKRGRRPLIPVHVKGVSGGRSRSTKEGERGDSRTHPLGKAALKERVRMGGDLGRDLGGAWDHGGRPHGTASSVSQGESLFVLGPVLC